VHPLEISIEIKKSWPHRPRSDNRLGCPAMATLRGAARKHLV